jgi:hypothetical protein
LSLSLNDTKNNTHESAAAHFMLGMSFFFANKKKHEILQCLHYRRKCPFCREPVPNSSEDYDRMDRERIRERVKANDHVAVELTAIKCYEEGDYDGAFK